MREKIESTRTAVFLDRDGTINKEKNYLHRIEDFEFIPGIPQALKKLQDAGFLLVVVTNQSGVARGYFSLAQVHRLHDHIGLLLNDYGVKIDGFYICPHHHTKGFPPFNIACDCRKGKPGMLLQAAGDLAINLSRSYMIGDKKADLQAGITAGCHSLLVRTGYGMQVDLSGEITCDGSFRDLPEAADYILENA